jgi:hypothetical protein
MMDSSAQDGSHLPAFLILAAAISIFAYALVRRVYSFFKVRNAPLTRADTFLEHDSQSKPADSVRPRLTPIGHTAVIFAIVMATLLAGLAYAGLHMFTVHNRLAKAGQTITANEAPRISGPIRISSRWADLSGQLKSSIATGSGKRSQVQRARSSLLAFRPDDKQGG